MAKLMIGSGITLEAQLPLLDTVPKIGPAVIEQKREDPDIQAMIDRAIAMLPKPELLLASPPKLMPIPIVDLNPLETAISNQAQRLMEHNDRLLKLENTEPIVIPSMVIPEVKQITHVKDVSHEVKLEIYSVIKEGFHAVTSDMENELKKQHKINLVLSGLVLLTIILHFI
jgi:hypothetical protein